MAYKVIILYQLYMPSYFLGTFTEYPYSVATILLYLYDIIIQIAYSLLQAIVYQS